MLAEYGIFAAACPGFKSYLDMGEVGFEPFPERLEPPTLICGQLDCSPDTMDGTSPCFCGKFSNTEVVGISFNQCRPDNTVGAVTVSNGTCILIDPVNVGTYVTPL